MIYTLLLVVFIGIMLFQFFNVRQPDVYQMPTSEFVQVVKEDRATEVHYNASTGAVEGEYYKDADAKGLPETFHSTFVGEEALNQLIEEHPDTKFEVKVNSGNIWMTLLTTILPLVIIVGVFWFFMSQMQGANNKQMQFGKTKAKKTAEERPKVRFSDVAGIDEAVEELEEIRDFLANPKKYEKMGAKIPHGVILVGPPGTGKTLLAKAIAGEAGVPFFSISGSDFVEMFVGVGASRVRDLFDQAKAAAPSIIFIDEIDAVGRQRGAGLGGGHDEREQTLNQLLVEMDGFEDHQSVILIAATNRVDILDPALLRPGRFDRQIVVDRPDLKGREQILKVHSKGKPLASNIDLARLAQLTSGFTGADLANLMNEAALLAARRQKETITNDELNEAIERVVAGPERKSRIITETEKKTIAYHESGHALVGHLLDHADPVHKISIIARGQALGYTLSIPEEDHFLVTKSHMIDDLAMFLGGRVAEEIAMGDITTGASNDLERATKMAKQMVTRYGMTDSLGHQVYGEANHEVFLGRDYGATPDYSEQTANAIDVEVTRLMREAHDRAYKILTDNREQLDLMANVLLERETVEGDAVKALLDNKWDEYLASEAERKQQKALAEAQVFEDDSHKSARKPPRERKAAEQAKRLREEAGAFTPFGPSADGKPVSDDAFSVEKGGSSENDALIAGDAGASADTREFLDSLEKNAGAHVAETVEAETVVEAEYELPDEAPTVDATGDAPTIDAADAPTIDDTKKDE
ncbi:MAG: ATP-dependent zinc metalloprotease FtsH [Coriobacteriales bacterium]